MKEFGAIYKEYYHALFAFLLRLSGGDRLLAEELTQEAFYQAFISIHRYNGKCQFFTWLCQIAKNSYFKYLQKHKEVSVDFGRLEEELLCDSGEDPGVICETKLMKGAMRRAIGRLKKKQKDVLILRVYFELSFREIGKSLGISETAAKVNYHRGKEMLRKELSHD